ncbi:PAS fold family [Synechococcus sp. PCC 7335]|uniref:sensor histidine kinase n=1 Tax=Synechococcus sp. (strain ATCC 29403 / PCC 7335) TaxID=91464 RepID=UPI00017ED29D|nr:ATP-binding protein [Synechococcus sp. PCC 7335]EDX85565.1 PAS fold family [Synechococcus sp. PCC 7335]
MNLSTGPSESIAVWKLLDAIAQPVYVKTANHKWLYVNEPGAALIGLPAEAIIGRSEADFLPQQLARQLTQQDKLFFDSARQSETPLLFETTDGTQHLVGHRRLFSTADLGIQSGGETTVALVNTLQDMTALACIRENNNLLHKRLESNQAKLRKAQQLESTLKRITDRVRESLDEQQILQTAVNELVEVLNAKAANTALYDLEQGTSTVLHECAAGLAPMRGRVSSLEAYPEVYQLLLAGQYLQFCSIFPNPERGRVSMFAAPIEDDRVVLGDLWLINDKDRWFSESEIRLVQQVTNQCGIAIRQARLYQESQSQVRELEHVNTLKDDFLSTVSHELRTPVTSMRVAIQMLGITLKQEYGMDEEELKKPLAKRGRLARYYSVLNEECEREISLVNDLLDLQRLDVGNHPMMIQPIKISSWLPGIVNGFKPRTNSRKQELTLTIKEDLPELISDLASVERIITELINNACKYTPPEHSIQVEITGEPHSMKICVTNTGVEIAEEERDLIFDKFYRVPSADPWKQGGTGLGLALIEKLVEHLEGTITVDSGMNQTVFIVELPLLHSAA